MKVRAPNAGRRSERHTCTLYIVQYWPHDKEQFDVKTPSTQLNLSNIEHA
jgi:hypothetical protein